MSENRSETTDEAAGLNATNPAAGGIEPRLTLPEVVADFAAYHAAPGNGAWGSLHVVLDDGNVSDDFVRGCVAYARAEGDAEGERLAGLLLRLSKTQRLKLPHLVTARRAAP